LGDPDEHGQRRKGRQCMVLVLESREREQLDGFELNVYFLTLRELGAFASALPSGSFRYSSGSSFSWAGACDSLGVSAPRRVVDGTLEALRQALGLFKSVGNMGFARRVATSQLGDRLSSTQSLVMRPAIF